MQPNGFPPATPPQAGHNPYAFITEPGKPVRHSLLPTGGSKQARLMLVAGLLLGLAVVGTFIAVIVSNIGSGQKTEWLSLAQQQQELIRVASIGTTKAQSTDVKNLATTTLLSLESSQVTINNLAKRNGATVSSKTLALGKNSKTDADLKTAEQTNQFDKAYKTVLQTELNDYQAQLKKLYDGSSSKSTKAGLSTAYANAGLLATRANQ